MVQFINCFEVPAGREDDFMVVHAEINAFMASQPHAGYLGHRLLKSLTPDAKYRFINFVEWESPEHWAAAHGPDFLAMVSRPDWAFFTSVPALYDVAYEGTP